MHESNANIHVEAKLWIDWYLNKDVWCRQGGGGIILPQSPFRKVKNVYLFELNNSQNMESVCVLCVHVRSLSLLIAGDQFR